MGGPQFDPTDVPMEDPRPDTQIWPDKALSGLPGGYTLADPWAHRSVGMTCQKCMWYCKKASDHSPHPSPEVGRCRRHAPVSGGHGFPVVYPLDWCGDHKIDETK